jgi:hypothetical protein
MCCSETTHQSLRGTRTKRTRARCSPPTLHKPGCCCPNSTATTPANRPTGARVRWKLRDGWPGRCVVSRQVRGGPSTSTSVSTAALSSAGDMQYGCKRRHLRGGIVRLAQSWIPNPSSPFGGVSYRAYRPGLRDYSGMQTEELFTSSHECSRTPIDV